MPTTATVRCPADTAKAGIDAMIVLASSVRGERDPIEALISRLLEMRFALDSSTL